MKCLLVIISPRKSKMEKDIKLEFERIYSGRRVLVTGHTGFTGGWLVSWLSQIGADVTGLALAPNTNPNLFDILSLSEKSTSILGDINDRNMVEKVFESCRPEIVFHLAAQSLVSEGVDNPVNTFLTNVMGTLHVLETARHCPETRAVVCITTDKVYANSEERHPFTETDPLGGKDPYSASKACAELVADAYRQTLVSRENGVRIATARGGNIIGGGDWSANRIVPDFVRAIAHGCPLGIRNPDAIRPWQHVLCLAHGYLLLGSMLLSDETEIASAWNFGPLDSEAKTVEILIEALSENWEKPAITVGPKLFSEAHFLQLDSGKARKLLGWQPSLTFEDSARMTTQWYRAYYEEKNSAQKVTQEQIFNYRQRLMIDGA
jgi:CDP-glucose 4,6-dehydratase